MRVSDLIKFRDELVAKLEFLTINDAVTQSREILKTLLTQYTNVDSIIAQGKIQSALSNFKELNDNANTTIAFLKTAIDDINQDIDKLVTETIIKKDNYPYTNYNKQFLFTQSEEITKFIFERLRRYSDFRYPGMQLSCESPYLTSEMVVNDPLYLCDYNIAHIDNTIAQFNDLYRRRIQKYLLPNKSLELLPQNQFGFVLCWMHFNYYELETLEIFLRNIFDTLRPGGVFMFSYNNGDLLSSCILSEFGQMSFIPKRNLIKICMKLGFEIIEFFDMPNIDDAVKYISWIEMKKPGTLKSIKISQSIGIIYPK